MNDICPCDSQKKNLSCCEPFLTGKKVPETPEELMRSRYTAYTKANIDYIKETMRGNAIIGFREADAKRWAKKVCWIKLRVFNSFIENTCKGYVEFEASFVENSLLNYIHEKSKFIREDGRWYYVDGTPIPSTSPEQQVSRTKPCPCGSQRKFKHCHEA